MSYDAILMGLISRVQKLELQVKTLSDRLASITGETVLPEAGRPTRNTPPSCNVRGRR